MQTLSQLLLITDLQVLEHCLSVAGVQPGAGGVQVFVSVHCSLQPYFQTTH